MSAIHSCLPSLDKNWPLIRRAGRTNREKQIRWKAGGSSQTPPTSRRSLGQGGQPRHSRRERCCAAVESLAAILFRAIVRRFSCKATATVRAWIKRHRGLDPKIIDFPARRTACNVESGLPLTCLALRHHQGQLPSLSRRRPERVSSEKRRVSKLKGL